MKKPLISIIVPVYKVEQYIKQCLDSIINQTYSNWELLLIDDGTPDKSGIICDEYAKFDARIQVIHKKNEGVSKARNLGIKLAKGEWITFIDSDDWIEATCLDYSIALILHNNLDLLQVSLKRINDEKQIVYINQCSTDVLNNEQYIFNNKFLCCAGGNFFKKKLITQHNLTFDHSLKLGEDRIFFYNYIHKCKRCQRIDNLFYNYRYNCTSASVVSNYNDCLVSLKYFQTYYLRSYFERQFQEAIYSFLFLIARTRKLSTKEMYNLIKDESFNLIKPNRKIDCIFLFSFKLSKRFAISLLPLIRKIY